jgi:hypothetical protein
MMPLIEATIVKRFVVVINAIQTIAMTTTATTVGVK